MILAASKLFTVTQVLQDKWWLAVLSLFVGLLMTPLMRWVAYHFKIVDKPDNLLKPHGRTVAYLGGVSMCIALLAGLTGYLCILPDFDRLWERLTTDVASGTFISGNILGNADAPGLMFNPIWKIAAIMLSCVLITLVGLLDDLFVLTPRQKIIGQVTAAAILIVGGVAAQMSIMFLYPIMGKPPVWLVLPLSSVMCATLVICTCNATNLLDGLDGLCGGVTGIISIGFLILAIWLAEWGNFPRNDGIRLALCLAMAGAVIGFLPYNLPPASIFMGDAGSMLLGFFVAVMMCLFCREGTARWFFAACVIFALPIMDTGLAVVRRLLSGKRIFEGDRSHLYDQLVDRGMSVKQVVAMFYFLSVAAAVIGVLAAVYLQFRYALPLYAVLLLIVAGAFRRLGMFRPHTHQPPSDVDKQPPGNATK